MFENRSFDNLLGGLYEPSEVASFEGVTGLDLSNPIPEWEAICRADAVALISDVFGHMFPGLHVS